MIAGMLTESNIIGYPVGFPYNEVNRAVNAFTMGAREVNPDAEVQVVYVNTWFDPAVEQQAAEALVNAGADVLAHEVGAQVYATVAAQTGGHVIGYTNDWSADRARGVGLVVPLRLGHVLRRPGQAHDRRNVGAGDHLRRPGRRLHHVRPVRPRRHRRDARHGRGAQAEHHRRHASTCSPARSTTTRATSSIAEGETIPFDERIDCCQWLVEGVVGSDPRLTARSMAVTAVEPCPVSLEVRGLTKSFFDVPAIDAVDFDVVGGEVHGLLGENGAGKSTLCSVLAGLYRPDAGEIMVDGEAVHLRSPHDAAAPRHRHGVPALPARRTLHRRREHRPRACGRRSAAGRCARSSSGSASSSTSTASTSTRRRTVWQLSVGEQQRVEIVKQLFRGAGILILDEPTAVLAPHESDRLFARGAPDGRHRPRASCSCRTRCRRSSTTPTG